MDRAVVGDVLHDGAESAAGATQTPKKEGGVRLRLEENSPIITPLEKTFQHAGITMHSD